MEVLRKFGPVCLLGVLMALMQVSVFNTIYPLVYIDALLIAGTVLFTLSTDDYSLVFSYGVAGLITHNIILNGSIAYSIIFVCAGLSVWVYEQQLLTESLLSYTALGAGVTAIFGILYGLFIGDLSLFAYSVFIIVGTLSLGCAYIVNNRLKRFIGRRFYSRNTY